MLKCNIGMGKLTPLSPISEKTTPDPVRISRKQSMLTRRFVELLRLRDQRAKIRRFFGGSKVPTKAARKGKL